MKIKHYKEQDKKAGRDISYSYVNKAWFMNNFKSNCVSCGCSLGYEIENGKVITSLTANRKHNDDGHNMINIEPMCNFCNCSLSNSGENIR